MQYRAPSDSREVEVIHPFIRSVAVLKQNSSQALGIFQIFSDKSVRFKLTLWANGILFLMLPIDS